MPLCFVARKVSLFSSVFGKFNIGGLLFQYGFVGAALPDHLFVKRVIALFSANDRPLL